MNSQVISIVCPIYNEEKYIEACIASILQQDYPQTCIEVLFVDGMSTDNTRNVVLAYAQKYPFIHLLNNPHKTVPYAMNIGIEQSKGEVIIRLDGHCEYPSNYVSRLVEQLYALDADNVGGIWHTQPANNTISCRAIAIASSHSFGVGASDHKVGCTQIKAVDTVPFGCYKREIFNQIGLFDEELTRNQDDEFNGRLIKNGGKIYLIPDLVINYTARNSIAKMSKMYYQYGLFKPLVNKKLGAPATLRQFFPLLFVLGLLIGPFCSLLYSPLWHFYGAVVGLYFLLAFVISFVQALKHRLLALFFVLPFVFLTVHSSYGWGYLVGLYKIFTKQSFQVQFNR